VVVSETREAELSGVSVSKDGFFGKNSPKNVEGPAWCIEKELESHPASTRQDVAHAPTGQSLRRRVQFTGSQL
jgi:hypothetical protein